MIDIITPYQVNEAIQKFAKGGNIPVDVQADLDEFEQELANPDLSPQERDQFAKAIENIRMRYPDESEINTIDFQTNSIDFLVAGNWFKAHPDKLLGNITVDKDRYGAEIQVLKGDISVMDKIELDSDLMQLQKNVSIGLSSSNDTIEQKIVLPSVAEFIESTIEKSNVNIGKKAVARKKKESENVNSDYADTKADIRSFKQVFNELNPEISNEEVRVYIWYKEQIGQALSDEWYDLAYGDIIRPAISEEQIKIWVESGYLFYSGGELLPLPLYASGNVYEKMSRIMKAGENSGQDIPIILERFGQKALDEHLRVLNESYKKLYENRLMITGNEDENSLIIKPTSKFSRNFMISSTFSFEEFKWYPKGKKGESTKPNFEKLDGSDWKKDTYPELSLTDAFCLWLTAFRNKIEFKGNISYYDIIYFHINKQNKKAPENISEKQYAEFRANLERTKAKAAAEGNRLFLVFLAEELDLNQKIQVETLWNSSFNNYMKPDYDKIPVAFNITNNFGGEIPFVVKPEKREAVSFIFNEGSGCLAYDVGVGKTICAIMIMEQFIVAGYSKRPFLVVPNQTYKQWISEVRNALPHRKINPLYNLGVDYIGEVLDENNEVMMVEENSITILTYEGFRKLGFNDQTQSELLDSLYDILNQGSDDEKSSEKKTAKLYQKLEKLVGVGLKGTNVEIERLGFDFVCFDEAHALKKVFTSVKGDASKGDKNRKQYDIKAGDPSDEATKGFMIANYILKKNNYRNILLLTATPFTNSPLEVFSMLSLVAYHHLAKLGIVNINDFFDNYIDVSTDLVINHKLQPQYKQIVKGFNNLPSLQKIIFRFFNYKDGYDVGVERPNKIVIPYNKKLVNGTVVKLPLDEQVSCNVEMSSIQKEQMADVILYAEGKGELTYSSGTFEDIEDAETTVGYEVSESELSAKEKAGVRALRAMNFSRNIALSPYLYEYSGLGAPTYDKYISTSPKLQYVMECIRSVKNYHIENNEPVSGQVVYMDRGLKYFDLLKEYLIKDIGFENHEIGIIASGMTAEKKRLIQDSFLGRKYNDKLKEYEDLDDALRIKVLIGSSSIKEGMNLQAKSTVLYNCFLDWNPTDIVQLEGRIWRQRNEFANVRIVNPLVIDSIDIFMFQKLEEKTARINTIWSVNGKSVFKLEEIDPEEIKFALIKDPKVIAKLEVETKAVKLQDDINSIKVINERLENYKRAQYVISNYEDQINGMLDNWAEKKKSLDTFQKINFLVSVFRSDKPKDDEGRLMINGYERRMLTDRNKEARYANEEISPYDPPYRSSSFTTALEAKRLIEKEDKDLLSPRNIPKDSISDYILSQDVKLKSIEEEITDLKSDEYVSRRTSEIEQKRLENKFELKSIDKLVNEFSRLNYLLSLKMVKKSSNKIKPFVYDQAVFMDSDGKRKIDPVTIELLTQGVNSLIQTKDMFVDEAGNYTPERLKLHYDIIDQVKSGVNCIHNDAPIAILTGGSPASGKSTFLKTYAPYLLSEHIMKIDADEIRAKLPEYEGWNAAVTHLETKDIVNTLLTDSEIGIPCDFDIIYDGTMNSTKNYLPLIGMLKRLGYKVFIVYMDNVPYDVVKDRMLKRYQSSGRFVPVEVIDDFFSKGKQALDELKTKVDGYMVIDASSKDYHVIEEGGMKLPSERNYDKIGNPIKEEAFSDEKKKVLKEIEDLKGLIEFVQDGELIKINKEIQDLSGILQYI